MFIPVQNYGRIELIFFNVPLLIQILAAAMFNLIAKIIADRFLSIAVFVACYLYYS